MAKTFLTNINLKGNQLLNAALQPSASAPNAITAGQLYFNTAEGIFYFSTGAGTGNWSPVGVQYIESVATPFSVTDKELSLNLGTGGGLYLDNDGKLAADSTSITFNTATQTLTNKTLGNVKVTGTTSFKDGSNNTYLEIYQSGVGTARFVSTDDMSFRSTDGDIILYPGNDNGGPGKAYVHWGNDATGAGPQNEITTAGNTQTFTNKTVGDQLTFNDGSNDSSIDVNGNDLYVNASHQLTLTTGSGDIILNPDGDIYRGSVTSDNRIITVGDIPNLELHIEGTTDQIVLSTDTENGYTKISLPSYINIYNGELDLRKTEYWKDGSQQGVIAAQSDSSLRLTATAGQLQLESNSGDVRINPSSTVTWFNNNLQINGDGGTITTDANSLHLNADSGVVTTDTNEFHTPKVELWNNGDTSGTRLGVILAHPSDGSLSVAASNQLILESHSGDIILSPSSENVQVYAGLTLDNGYNITSGNNIYTKNIYVGGADYGVDGNIRVQDANGNNVFTVSANSDDGSAIADIHGSFSLYRSVGTNGAKYADISSDADQNLVINAYQNNLILQSDNSNSVFIGSVSDGNKVAKISDIHAASQGLSVLAPVVAASGVNIDITATHTAIGGVTLSNNDRVLLNAQATATENGIYVYNSGTSLLVPSTNQDDVLKEGSYTLVTKGTYAAQGYIVTSVPYSNATIWTQFSAAGEYLAGTGITISGNTISVTEETYDAYGASGTALSSANTYTDNQISTLHLTSKYVGTVTGDDETDTFTITHSLGKRSVTVQVYQTSGSPDTQWSDVEVDIVRNSVDTVTVGFGSAPQTGTTYDVVIIG
jgi:hypothetical protein